MDIAGGPGSFWKISLSDDLANYAPNDRYETPRTHEPHEFHKLHKHHETQEARKPHKYHKYGKYIEKIECEKLFHPVC